MEKLIAIIFLFFTSPILMLLYLVVKFSSKGSFIFKQKRAGKNKKVFTIYKIRTMVEGAEMEKKKLQKLNEGDGPVFKIREDPRYTKFGKFISHTGLDELPQLVNIIKGEMSFVGPRPLPIEEAKKIPKKYQLRFSILPGITSPWVVKGSHKLSFKEWMDLDLIYIKNKSLWYDLKISTGTVFLMLKALMLKLLKNNTLNL